MKRPLPPELIALGDQLESAAGNDLGRRRARRQTALNAAASLIIAVPLAITLATSELGSTTAVVTPTPTPRNVATVDGGTTFTRIPDDYLPRDFRRMKSSPNAELLLLPPDIPRPALR